MIARECELNSVVRMRLYHIIEQLKNEFEKEDFEYYYIHKHSNGSISIRIKDTPSQHADYDLSEVQTNVVEKLMLEVATHDPKLYAKLILAYDSYVDMVVIRESIIEFIESDDPFYRRNFRDVVSFSMAELTEADQAMTSLYKECTGKSEIAERFR